MNNIFLLDSDQGYYIWEISRRDPKIFFRKKIDQKGIRKFSKILNSLQTESITTKTDIPSNSKLKKTSHDDSTSSNINGTKTLQLINELQKNNTDTIKPFVDFNEGNLFYPFLSKIGLVQNNIDFLESLVIEGILEKKIFEKLVVCPVHPNTYSSSVHMYCPNCHSINVEKLNLFEHKKCGYISDGKNFDFSNPDQSECPSCKKTIKNFDKEVRVPAMWFQCNICDEKFDNIDVKLHCRKYEHDFDTNSAQFVPTYCYVLKNSENPLTSEDTKIIQDLSEMLDGFNFNSEINSSVIGKSGNSHKIPILGCHQTTGEKIIIFVSNSEQIQDSAINSILVPVLDIEPKHTLLVTRYDVSDSVYAMATRYKINIISHPELSELMSLIEAFLSNTSDKGVKNEK